MKVYWCLLVVFLCFAKYVHSHHTDPSQLQVLQTLYDSTNGPGWLNKDGWNDGDACYPTAWSGVTCVVNSATLVYYVKEIRLPDNNLVGNVPDLGALVNLEIL